MLVNLEEFSMFEILGIAEKSRGDLVTLYMKNPHLFMVYSDGHVIFASYRKLLGEEAFLSALLLKKGQLEIKHLPLDIRIRPNITYTYEELLQEGTRREQDFESIMSRVGSLNVVPKVCRQLKVEQLCVNWLHWGIIVGAFKGHTVYELADVLRVSEYELAKALLDLVESGAITTTADTTEPVVGHTPVEGKIPTTEPVVGHTPVEGKIPTTEPVVGHTPVEGKIPTTEPVVGHTPVEGKIPTTEPVVGHTPVEGKIPTTEPVVGHTGQVRATVVSNRFTEQHAGQTGQNPFTRQESKDRPVVTPVKKPNQGNGASRAEPSDKVSTFSGNGISAAVSVLPFGASLGSGDAINDTCLAISSDLFQQIIEKFGEHVTDAYVLNPEKPDLGPLLVKLVPSRQVASAALTVGAFLKLGAKNGQTLTILPVIREPSQDGEG